MQEIIEKLRVLIVDDLFTDRTALLDMLREIGFKNVVEAKNGREALDQIQNKPIGLVISDWKMPDVNGVELLQLVRSDPNTFRIPFIMISAYDDKMRFPVKELVSPSLTTYLLKPVSFDTIKSTVINLVEKWYVEPFKSQNNR